MGAKTEAPDLYIARLENWCRRNDGKERASGSLRVRVGCGECPADWTCFLERDGYAKHRGDGDTPGEAIDRALDAAERSVWRVP